MDNSAPSHRAPGDEPLMGESEGSPPLGKTPTPEHQLVRVVTLAEDRHSLEFAVVVGAGRPVSLTVEVVDPGGTVEIGGTIEPYEFANLRTQLREHGRDATIGIGFRVHVDPDARNVGGLIEGGKREDRIWLQTRRAGAAMRRHVIPLEELLADVETVWSTFVQRIPHVAEALRRTADDLEREAVPATPEDLRLVDLMEKATSQWSQSRRRRWRPEPGERDA